MDPVTAAILAAIAAGSSKVLQQGISDAYEGLKGLLKRKFGHDHGVVKAVTDLEAEPESEGYKLLLKEKVQRAKAADDPEIVKKAQEILDKLDATPGGSQVVQHAVGSYIAQASHGGTASVNINRPDTPTR